MTTTAKILLQLDTAKSDFRRGVDSAKEVVPPIVGKTAEIVTKIGTEVAGPLVGVPVLGKFGMFAAPVVGKAAEGVTELALDGVKEVGSGIIDFVSEGVKLVEDMTEKQPTFNPNRLTLTHK